MVRSGRILNTVGRQTPLELKDARRPGREVFYYPETLLPWLRTVGWARLRRAKPDVLMRHAHHGFLEISWLRQGRLDWWVGSERVRIRPGDLLVVRPDEAHGANHAALEPCEMYWLQLADRAPAAATGLAALLPVLRQAPRLVAGDPALAEPWRAVLSELAQPDRWSPQVVHGALDVLCARLARCLSTTAAAADTSISPAVRRAMAWVDGQEGWIYPIAALARAAGLSSARLSGRFTTEVGLSPAAWMRRRRIDTAQRLLASTRLEITAIAMRLGYRSSQHFATQFRQAVGIPPHLWRRQEAAC